MRFESRMSIVYSMMHPTSIKCIKKRKLINEFLVQSGKRERDLYTKVFVVAENNKQLRFPIESTKYIFS